MEEEVLEEEEVFNEALKEDEEVFDSVTVILVFKGKLILAYFLFGVFFMFIISVISIASTVLAN